MPNEEAQQVLLDKVMHAFAENLYAAIDRRKSELGNVPTDFAVAPGRVHGALVGKATAECKLLYTLGGVKYADRMVATLDVATGEMTVTLEETTKDGIQNEGVAEELPDERAGGHQVGTA